MLPQVLFVLTAFALTCASALGQSALDTSKFEVASVRPAAPRTPDERVIGTMRGGPGTPDPERITYRAVTLLQVLRTAYGKTNFEISGPDWLIVTAFDSPRFDIVANVPTGTSKEQLNGMLQNLMIERFGLKLHHETRAFMIYTLIVGKNGSKLKESEKGGGGVTVSPREDGYKLRSLGGATVSTLAAALQNRLNELVIDKTGLTGNYAFSLEFADNTPAVSDAPLLPSLSTALNEELGLKLEREKVDLDVLVVDNIERAPTAN